MNAVTDPISHAPSPLVFTESADTKVKDLIDEEGNSDLKLLTCPGLFGPAET